MNILLLNWRDPKNPKSGGAEVVTLEHARAWVRAGHHVIWFSSYFPDAKKTELIDGVEIIRSGNSLSVYITAALYYLKQRKVIDFVVDEIHGIPFFTPLYVRKPKIAFIHEVAGTIWDYMYPFPFNLFGKLLERLYLWLYRNQVFWTDAPSTKEELKRFGIHHVVVIACPISNPIVSHLPDKEKEPTFIFFSRLVKMKGIEQIIISFTEIVRKMPTAQLWIVGTGEERYLQQLRGSVTTRGLTKQVTFYGFVSESKKLALLRKAHLLLHASVKEGWGLVVLEAASQATPAVVYNVGGLRDVVRNGETGVVLTENSPENMAAAVFNLMNNKMEYARLQKNCLLYAKTFDWQKSSKESLSLIESLCKKDS